MLSAHTRQIDFSARSDARAKKCCSVWPRRHRRSWSNDGNRTRVTHPDGQAFSNAYDAVSRLTSLAHGFTGTSNNVSFSFGYNPASQMISRAMSNDLYSYHGDYDVVRPYGVNGLNRITVTVH
jgi:YD repeat-containing protein